ncbi:MAG TPA: hypothetical protein VGG98_00190 [Solirubrobacteraceae bacterium]|jgi:predicted lipoprotein with Yx(FWY)xxD motif
MTRNRLVTFLSGVASVAAVAIGSVTAMAATAPKTNARSATVRVANSRFGQILVDSRGHTLYEFSKDSRTRSACFGECAVAWPPLRASGKPTVGFGAHGSLIGTIRRSDGKPQVTYNGHPLYDFVMDRRPGEANGEGLTAFGGRWVAISPTGKQASPKPRPAAPSTGSSPSPSANNGIPQGNGGDGDADNNGGPSDGDGDM